ncbi:MAG: hypothetical protein M3R70_03265 [Actinomycetota bacterium]|nr:hypothetical protein [Actinomycetota bacterium]
MGLRDRLRERKLSKDGLPAEAAILTNTLVDKRMTGTYVSTVGEYGHYLYEVRLVLEVRPEDGEPFRAEVQDTFKQSVFDCLPQIGGTVPVHYDPGDRSVALDLDAIVQRAENLMQDLKKTQDAKDAAVLGGADPKAARMTEAETMLGQVQGAGFMSPEMQSLAQQAQSFMGNWQLAAGGRHGTPPSGELPDAHDGDCARLRDSGNNGRGVGRARTGLVRAHRRGAVRDDHRHRRRSTSAGGACARRKASGPAGPERPDQGLSRELPAVGRVPVR